MTGDGQQRRGWLFVGANGYWKALVLTVLLGVLAAGCGAALMFTSGELISRSALRPENVLMVYVPIVLVRTFGLGKAALQYAERLAGHHAALRALSAMRVKLYRLLERQAIHLHSRYRLGDLLGLLADDIEQLQNVYLRVAFPALTGVILYGGVVVLLANAGGLALIWLIAYSGFWLFAAPLLALWRVKRLKQPRQQERSLLYSELADAWFGLTDWVLSGRSKQAIASFRERQAAFTSHEQRLRRMEWRRQWFSRSATAGAVLLTAIWVSSQLEDGRMENIWAAACILAVFPLMETFARVHDALIRLPDYQRSLQRLAQVETEASQDVCAHAVKQVESTDRLNGQDDVQSCDVQVERVSFRYDPNSAWILHDLSLALPQGKKVAVLGRSGAGKSTLLQVLSGQRRPEQGTVLVNSQPWAEKTTRFCSILNQKPYLFHTSLANNLWLGRNDASEEELWQAIRRVGLDRLVQSLPDGLDTDMDEAGSRFSGGERQRIALARILLQDRPVVLLDEPTTGLDRLTELALIETMFDVLQDRTVVWFTHRLTGMETMDEILFLEQGAVTMRGTHAELLRREERYRRLYELDHLL